jgi:hypothetical protein
MTHCSKQKKEKKKRREEKGRRGRKEVIPGSWQRRIERK